MSMDIPPMVTLTREEEAELRKVVAAEPRVKAELERARRAGLDIESTASTALAQIEHAKQLLKEYGGRRRPSGPATGTP